MTAKQTDPTFVATSDVSGKQDILAVFLETSSTLVDDESLKRVRKCSGCKLPHDVHSWGPPGPYCTGPNEDAQADEDDEEALQDQLQKLKLAEQELAKASRIRQLKKAIAESQQCLVELQEKPPLPSLQSLPQTSTSSAPGSAPPSNPMTASSAASSAISAANPFTSSAIAAMSFTKTAPVTPLDTLLAGYQTGAAPQAVNNPDRRLAEPQAAQESRMFLKPAHLAKGEEILRIVDFIDKIVSTVEDRTRRQNYGPKKPKLEAVTIAQWVIANIRIFRTLLSAGKLPSPQDVQHYLAYTIKIMELSTKFTLCSVLKYDDEFRHVQAVYNYPWSYDSNHLHTVLLEPLPPKATPARAPPVTSFARYSGDGRTISIINFNRPRGCTLYECHFAHVCNRKVNGKACGQLHPSHTHPQGGRAPMQGQGQGHAQEQGPPPMSI